MEIKKQTNKQTNKQTIFVFGLWYCSLAYINFSFINDYLIELPGWAMVIPTHPDWFIETLTNTCFLFILVFTQTPMCVTVT